MAGIDREKLRKEGLAELANLLGVERREVPPAPAPAPAPPRIETRSTAPQPMPGPEPPPQPEPAPPAEPPAPEKTSEEAWDALREARVAYVDEYKLHRQTKKERLGFLRSVLLKITGEKEEEGNLPDSLRGAKEKYDGAKLSYGQALRREGIEATQIFQELVIAEKENLQKAQIETWPPKEKNIVKKALDWWIHLPRWQRIGISTALMTGAFAAAGGSGVILFAGSRFVRGFLSAEAGQLAGKIVEWGIKAGERTGGKTWKEGQLDTIKDDAKYEIKNKGLSLDLLRNLEESYQELLNEVARDSREEKIIKGAVMLVAGGAASLGLSLMESSYAGGLKVREPWRPPVRDTTPTLRPTPMSTLAPETQWFPIAGVTEEPPPPKVWQDQVERHPKGMPAELRKPPAEVAPPEAPPSSPITPAEAAYEDIYTVKKGEGYWQPIYRQLEDHLQTDREKFANRFKVKITAEDLENNPAQIKKILNRVTGRLLIENKLMDGKEMRIAKPGVKVFLTEDTNEIVTEGKGKLTYEVSRVRPEPEPQMESPEYVIEQPARGQLTPESKADIESYEQAPRTSSGMEARAAATAVTETWSSGQREILEHTFNRNLLVRDELLEAGLRNIANQIKWGRLGVEHFNQYLWENKFIDKPLPPRTVENLKQSFKIIGGSNEAAAQVALIGVRNFLRGVIR